MKNCIIFDLFGVVFSKGLTSSIDDLTAVLDRTKAEITPVYLRWEREFDLGQIGEDVFWENVNRELGTTVRPELLTDIVISSYRLNSHTLELAKYLRHDHCLVAYSNYRREWFERLDEKFQISMYFDHVLISSDTGVLKPDSKAFAIVQEVTGIKPPRMALLDDERPNIQAALDWGAHGVLFENPYEAEIALRSTLQYTQPKYTKRYSGTLLATSAGALVLSRRDVRQGISNSGRLSVFGGRAKRGETPLVCAMRELREETGLHYSQDRFRHLTSFWWPLPDGGTELCDYFLVSDVAIDDIHVGEGQGFEVRWPHDALRQDLTVLPRLIIEHLSPHYSMQPPSPKPACARLRKKR